MTRPSHAEAARTLLAHSSQGALATMDRNSGAPYASVVEYVPMSDGDALLFVSALAEHTKNFSNQSEISLLVAESPGEARPLARPRVTAVGEISPCDDSRDALSGEYLKVHPHAETYIDFEDFQFFRLTPDRLRYIGGFGRMSWVEGADYREAEPDPIRPAEEEICTHLNEDHPDALLKIARQLGEAQWAEAAVVTAVDRHGFDLEVEAEEESRRDTLRLGFDESLEAPEEARTAFVELVERARSSQ